MIEPAKTSAAADAKAKAQKRRKRLATVVSVAGLLLVCFSFYAYQIFFTANIDTHERTAYVLIRRGSNWKQALDQVEKTGTVIDKLSLRFVGRLMGLDKPGAVKPGRYKLRDQMTNRQVINLLKSGRQSPLNLTFTNVRLRRELSAKLGKELDASPKQIDSLLSSPTFTRSLGFDTTTVLAMFVPNTYQVYWTTSPEKLLHRMKDEYEKFWTPARDEARQKLGLTRVQVSTLASIVEAEQQQHPDERPRIAAVYLNRLKRGMKLQADPTVVYANGDFTIKRVLNKHLQKDSPYNTYRVTGLPPGPIDLPSISSLDAVLHPEQNDYLYFCAKDDFSGYHAFAATEQQHLLNAHRYQAALSRAGIM